jgi:alpha-tubulin suppressor-like RCC1 family protein
LLDVKTEEGKVLSWGHGGHGQLGSSSLRNQKVPTEIEALADKKIVFIASGGSSSAAITGIFSYRYVHLT